MKEQAIIHIRPLDFLWDVPNPFLFCAHHLDYFPRGNDAMGPVASLAGRNLGEDFTIKDGWRMYHGMKVPGFPAHPHRGFETITIVLEGMVDHSDSWGQAGRYGMGDVQWMTAGSGLQHCEMFPLLNQDKPNTTELFQVWLNLPKAKKFAKPFYKMFWAEQIPHYQWIDPNGRTTTVRIIAGALEGIQALAPSPDSWAADPAHEVAIWTIKIEANGSWKLPATAANVNRTLYFYRGESIHIDDEKVAVEHGIVLNPNVDLTIQNGSSDAFLFLLQGAPIEEKVAKYGPFVMNTEEEIRQAIQDYRTTQFGGWPWSRTDMVHPREKGRFAQYLGGEQEQP